MTMYFNNSMTAGWFAKVCKGQGFPAQTSRNGKYIVEVDVPAQDREALIAKWASCTCSVTGYSAAERKKLFEPRKQEVEKQ